MVCDKPQARVVELAQSMGVPTFAFSAKDFASKAEYEREIVSRLRSAEVELICMAGYMKIVGEELLSAYEGRIINIHPSLLPSFKGARAIEQAMEYGVKVYGATIHYVDSSLDGGRIIAQRAIEYDGNSIEEVTAKIHSIEHELYIQTISKLLNKE